jgi:hypothetical protein
VAAQLVNALFAPGQVVHFLLGGVLHGLAHVRQFGRQRLALIQRLGADFAGVVDPHQAGDVTAVLVAERLSRAQQRRRWTRRLTAEGQQGAQGPVGLQQHLIQRRVMSFVSHEHSVSLSIE